MVPFFVIVTGVCTLARLGLSARNKHVLNQPIPGPRLNGHVYFYSDNQQHRDNNQKNLVCSFRVNQSYDETLTGRRRRRGAPPCQNDEIRSMRLVNLDKGTTISVF